MGGGFWLGLLAAALVAAASLLGGASLRGSGQRALMAFVFFGLSGWVLQTLWRAFLSSGATAPRQAALPQAAPGGQPQASAALAQAATIGQPATTGLPAATRQPAAGARLDQVLPPASPADLFEPLSPPVLTKDAMEE
ncbi:MAG: hypothetical protein ACM3ZA_08020 [Bacillota bacterium]